MCENEKHLIEKKNSGNEKEHIAINNVTYNFQIYIDINLRMCVCV